MQTMEMKTKVMKTIVIFLKLLIKIHNQNTATVRLRVSASGSALSFARTEDVRLRASTDHTAGRGLNIMFSRNAVKISDGPFRRKTKRTRG